jgi:hypothetical protein
MIDSFFFDREPENIADLFRQDFKVFVSLQQVFEIR